MPAGWDPDAVTLINTRCSTSSLRSTLARGATSSAGTWYQEGIDPFFGELVALGVPNPQQAVSRAAAILRSCSTFSYQYSTYTYNATVYPRTMPVKGLIDEHAYDETVTSGKAVIARILVIGRTDRATVLLEYGDGGFADPDDAGRIFDKAVTKAS
jgi:hypothetical protein